MSTQHIIQTILEVAAVLCICYVFKNEDRLIRFERRTWRKIKKFVRVFIKCIKIEIARRKNEMYVIVKIPGKEPERRHNVANNRAAIARELDAENLRYEELENDVFMWYDADGISKQLPFGITNDYADYYYYGDVLFSGKLYGEPQSLDSQQERYVMNYIRKNRTDKAS